jgi:hypothetical protein
MTYPFIDRDWVEVIEQLSSDEVINLFEYRSFEEMIEYESDDILLAFTISQSVQTGDAELTAKGRDFLESEGSQIFDDDVDYQVRILPEKALPYSWSKLSELKKQKITNMILDGYNEKVDGEYQFAEHFLTCIALLSGKSKETRSIIESVQSDRIKEALKLL